MELTEQEAIELEKSLAASSEASAAKMTALEEERASIQSVQRWAPDHPMSPPAPTRTVTPRRILSTSSVFIESPLVTASQPSAPGGTGW